MGKKFVKAFKNANTNTRFYMLFNGKTNKISDVEYKKYVMMFCEYDISLLEPFIMLYNKHIRVCESKIFLNNYKIDTFYQNLLNTSKTIYACLTAIGKEYKEIQFKKKHNLDFLDYDTDVKLSIINEIIANNFTTTIRMKDISDITISDNTIAFQSDEFDIWFTFANKHLYMMKFFDFINTDEYCSKIVDLGIYNRDRKLKEIGIID